MITYTEKRFFEWHEDEVSVTIRNKSGSYGGGSETLVINERSNMKNEPFCIGNGQVDQTKISEKVGALNCMHDQQAVIVPDIAGTLDGSYYKGCGERAGVEREVVAQAAVDCRNGVEDAEKNGTLQSKKDGGISYNTNNTVRQQSLVRRLTPTECERLQGFPDGWTLIGEPEKVEVKDFDIEYDEDGNEVGKTLVGTHKEIEYFYTDRYGRRKKCADSARYKALGNSIALPFWAWLARRICAQYDRPMTMASLFDGIGGFPLVFSRAGCTPVWASEIEDFPIEVTRRRFPE